MRTFRSDNCAGMCPEALAALADVSAGHQLAYGDDDHTAAAVAAFRNLFGSDIEVFFVATGTAANTLAIAALTEPWQQIVCHASSHVNNDESTAPERLTHCRVVPIQTASANLTPEAVRNVAGHSRRDVHQPQPGVLSLANATELGTVYSPAELLEISRAAHELGYLVHVDGARFANAVAFAACDPSALATDAGVDALTFGGTKNGLAFGDAVVFFRRNESPSTFERAVRSFPFHRKATGHLLSKHRFLTAQFAAVLRSGAWLAHAAHANAMAARLATGLEALGYRLAYPRQANGVFVRLSSQADGHLRTRGHEYYSFGPHGLTRLMCSFDTEPADVDRLLVDAANVAPEFRAVGLPDASAS